MTIAAAKPCAALRMYSYGLRVDAKRLDESRKGGGLVLPTRVVQEETGERWAPIFQNADQRSARKIFKHALFCHPRNARAVECALDHKVQLIENQRAIDRNRDRFIALVELPFVHALAAVPEPDAPVMQQISWRC